MLAVLDARPDMRAVARGAALTVRRPGHQGRVSRFQSTAVLLIDFQRAFLDGGWAKRHGLECGELDPVLQAAERTASALHLVRAKERSASVSALGPGAVPIPVMTTRCYLDAPDCEVPPLLSEHLATAPWVHKPTMDVMKAQGFSEWMGRCE